MKHVAGFNSENHEKEHSLTSDYSQILADKIMAIANSVAKTEFLAKVSHEMRTPLNSIIAMTEMLSKANLTQEQRKFLDMSNRASLNLLDLINNLIFLKKMELNEVHLHEKDADLYKIIKNSATLVLQKYKEKNLAFHIFVDPRLPHDIICDETKLQQVLTNILANAFKFTEKGQVEFNVILKSVKTNIAEIVFSIRDTGIGISQNQQNILFEKFNQKDFSLTRHFGGIGLSLAISAELIKVMNGKISVISQLKKGSVFRISFQFPIAKTNRKSYKTSLASFEPAVALLVSGKIEDSARLQRDISREKVVLDYLNEANILNNSSLLNFQKYDIIIVQTDNRRVLDKLYTMNKPIINLTSNLSDFDKSTFNKNENLLTPFKMEDFYFSIAKALGRVNHVEVVDKAEEVDANIQAKKQIEVLLAEDSLDNQNVVIAYLKNLNINLTLTHNGAEALEAYKNRNFDLVLMDIQMPEMDGYTATQEIRKYERENGRQSIPIIAVTAHALGSEMKKCLEVGCNEVITKPFAKNQLVNKINDFIVQSEQADELLEEIKQLRPTFINNKSNKLNDIKLALKNEDYPAIKNFGHTLKGDSRPYGFKVLEELGKELELVAGVQEPVFDSVSFTLMKIEQFLEEEKRQHSV